MTVLMAGMPVTTWADASDYAFELVETKLKQGDDVALAVKLVRKSTGEAVPDAVFLAYWFDMAPDDMASMVETLKPLSNDEPGVYRFRTSLPMEGRWRLLLAAHVPGETGVVEGNLIVNVVEP